MRLRNCQQSDDNQNYVGHKCEKVGVGVDFHRFHYLLLGDVLFQILHHAWELCVKVLLVLFLYVSLAFVDMLLHVDLVSRDRFLTREARNFGRLALFRR